MATKKYCYKSEFARRQKNIKNLEFYIRYQKIYCKSHADKKNTKISLDFTCRQKIRISTGKLQKNSKKLLKIRIKNAKIWILLY
jgi:hypothetical protein